MSSWLGGVGAKIPSQVIATGGKLKAKKTSVSLQGVPKPLVAVDIDKAAEQQLLGFSKLKRRADFLVFVEISTEPRIFVIELKGKQDISYGVKQLKATTQHLDVQSWIPARPAPALLPVLVSRTTFGGRKEVKQRVSFRGKKLRIKMLRSGSKLSKLL